MTVRLITTLPRKTLAFIEKARGINGAMTNNPNFRNVSPEFAATLALLSVKIDEMQAAYDEARGGDTHKIAYRDQAMAALKALLVKIATYAELYAAGNVTTLESTGFDVSRERSRGIEYPQVAATLALKHGKTGGTMIAMGKPLPGAWRYQTHITESDPTQEANWRPYADHRRCSHLLIEGLTAGRFVSVRQRGVWDAGAGPWSPICTLMSL